MLLKLEGDMDLTVMNIVINDEQFEDILIRDKNGRFL
jgi:hypothetical protein